MAIAHNMKAEKFINLLPNTEILDVSINEVIKCQGNAFAPSKPHPMRNEFWEDYTSKGFSFILHKYFLLLHCGDIKSRN